MDELEEFIRDTGGSLDYRVLHELDFSAPDGHVTVRHRQEPGLTGEAVYFIFEHLDIEVRTADGRTTHLRLDLGNRAK